MTTLISIYDSSIPHLNLRVSITLYSKSLNDVIKQKILEEVSLTITNTPRKIPIIFYKILT